VPIPNESDAHPQDRMSLLPYRATRVYRDLSRCLYQRDAQRLRVPTREAGVVDTSCQPSCHSTALSSAAMTSSDGTHSDSPTDVLRFRLVADRVGVGVDVRLQRSAVRWISVADSSGRRVTGIGPTARAAIVASVDWLGEATVSEFLADLRLLEVSRRLHELRAG
jgi:hypothetical protein